MQTLATAVVERGTPLLGAFHLVDEVKGSSSSQSLDPDAFPVYPVPSFLECLKLPPGMLIVHQPNAKDATKGGRRFWDCLYGGKDRFGNGRILSLCTGSYMALSDINFKEDHVYSKGRGLSREKLGEAMIPDDLLDDLIAAAENDEIYAFADKMQFPWVPVPLVGVKLSFKGEVVIIIDGEDFVVNLVRQNADSMAEVALALDHVTITLRGPRHVRNFPGIFRAKAMEFLRIKDTGMTLTADGREKLKNAKIASLKKMEAEVVITVMGGNRTSASVGQKRKAEGSTAAAPQNSHVMDEPIKFTPAPLTENELLLLADDQPSLRAVAVAVGAAADAEGMELPESVRGAAPVILRRTFKHTEFSTPMLQDNSPEEVAAVDAAGPAAAGESLEHGAGCDKEERRLSADSCHTRQPPAPVTAAAAAAAFAADEGLSE